MTDIEIATNAKIKPIVDIAKKLGINEDDLDCYGKYIAKINKQPSTNKKGKIVLVTAINPTSAGEGKTTVSIGLADALNLIGEKTCLAVREPSLGPVFGLKGGACGGGMSQIIPMEDINLHFTGDFHAITTANNLLSAYIDNHIFQGNELKIDPEKIVFNRCLDINDRALRDCMVASTCQKGNFRKERFVITASSEIMAILCLSSSLEDLKRRLGNILVAYSYDEVPIYAKDLHAEDSMTILLKNAIKPNLVQTISGSPAIVHGGPFANIAHGCNSIIATEYALRLADYVVTEAGFGADLGAEKFLDLKCQITNIFPSVAVVVATARALKLHGGVDKVNLDTKNLSSLEKGLKNLKKHVDNLRNVYKLPVIVAVNKFSSDFEQELERIKSFCAEIDVDCCLVDVWSKAGTGAIELAETVKKVCKSKPKPCFAYALTDGLEEKISKVATKIYGANAVEYSEQAKKDLEHIKNITVGRKLAVIIAKTQYSLSDDQTKLGVPKDFSLHINSVELRNGAEFVVAVAGKMLLMPGLPKTPAGQKMTIDKTGRITGSF